MIIAQNSVDIDENAKQAQDAMSRANELNNDINKKLVDTQGFMDGKITQSIKSPFESGADPYSGQHSNGDMWIQLSNDRQTAVSMFNYTDGGWRQQVWDQSALRVAELWGLKIHGGYIEGGTIEGVTMNSSNINVDISSNGAYDQGIDPVTWNANGFNPNDVHSPGFHFQNGLMQFGAQRVSGTDAGQWDFLFMGPNDVKLRGSNTPDTYHQNIKNRTDIRSDYVVTSSDGYAEPSVGESQDGCIIKSDGYATFTNGIYAPMINAGKSGAQFEIQSGVVTQYYMHAHGFKKNSDVSIKREIKDFSNKNALSEILGTDIYSYKYKNDNSSINIGPVIDNVNDINKPKYKTSEYIIDRGSNNTNYLSLSNTIGLLVGSVKELSKQNEQLLAKVTRLERTNNGNN